VASQVGSLPDVNVLTTAVDHVHGGLGVSFDSSGKVQNSVRDVAIANGILFVCDEPEKVVDLYALADGRYLGSSTALSTSPTHLATNNGGLYVSAVLGAAAAIRIGGVNILAGCRADASVFEGPAQDRRHLVRRSLHALHSISGRDRRQQEGGRIDLWLRRELAKSTSPDRRYRVRRLTAGHAGIRTLLAWQLTSPDTTHRPNWQRW